MMVTVRVICQVERRSARASVLEFKLRGLIPLEYNTDTLAPTINALLGSEFRYQE
jgi:hypothetical protein